MFLILFLVLNHGQWQLSGLAFYWANSIWAYGCSMLQGEADNTIQKVLRRSTHVRQHRVCLC
jgi:hypothetical protein